MTEDEAARVLRRRFGPLAVLSKCAGRWAVILMRDKRYGQGLRITDDCDTISRAVSQAIKYAIEEHVTHGSWLGYWRA